jgi:hypothetical protein
MFSGNEKFGGPRRSVWLPALDVDRSVAILPEHTYSTSYSHDADLCPHDIVVNITVIIIIVPNLAVATVTATRALSCER